MPPITNYQNMLQNMKDALTYELFAQPKACPSLLPEPQGDEVLPKTSSLHGQNEIKSSTFKEPRREIRSVDVVIWDDTRSEGDRGGHGTSSRFCRDGRGIFEGRVR